MRLSSEELKRITGRQQPCAQARWFWKHYGVRVEYDRQGPIITAAALEALVMKQLGLTRTNESPRPSVKLLKSARQ